MPYGTLLCVSDKPLHGEIKLAGMADEFYRQRVGQHLEIGLKALEKLKVQEWERFVFRQTSKLPKLPSNSLVDLMMHRGTIACAEIRFNRNNSPLNFNAMCHARVMYEAAVEAIGKDVVAESTETEDAALRPARLRPKQPPTKTRDPKETHTQQRPAA